MAKTGLLIGLIFFLLSLLPFALIARARAQRSDRPRVHLILDMDNQPKFKPQRANSLFADGRAMRPKVAGTVARGELELDDHLYRGIENGQWAETFPLRVDERLLRRGRERFDIFCAPCHGISGYGDGMVSRRADELQEGKWVPPTSLHTDAVRQRPPGHLYNTIVNGIRNMPAYGHQIGLEDRWAIVAYVRALQRSQNARPEDVPEEARRLLR